LHGTDCPFKMASIANLSFKTNLAPLSRRKNQMIIQESKKVMFENNIREINMDKTLYLKPILVVQLEPTW
jgi:hypothetical protein